MKEKNRPLHTPVLSLLAFLLAGARLSGLPAAARGEPRVPSVAPPTIEAIPVIEGSGVRLDGNLSDPAWLQAPAITGFVQRDPSDGAAPTHRTEVRVLFSQSAFYVAVRAFDPEPEKIVGILTRRDGDSPSDWIRVLIDSYHDRRTAYEFAVNPAGVKQDSYRFNDVEEDRGWDAVWDVAVATEEAGWSAEFRIPLSQLRFDPDQTRSFGFAVVRQIGRLDETSTWPLLSRSAKGYVSSFGELQGIQLAAASKRFELVPYSLGQLTTQPGQAGNPFLKTTDPGVDFGADLKVRLTPAVTLTGTVNPDFGQVEADPAVVNLTAFETFFAERRPFFVEGSGIFRFDINCSDGECTGLFYSRRIGRQPQGSEEVPEESHSAAPAQTTILSAAKLTGRLAGFSFGLLHALTAEEKARVALGDRQYRQPVEPLTSYSVARLRKEFTNQSSLGFMLTGTNRRLSDPLRFLPDEAYTGGIDWDFRLGKAGSYSLGGYWAGSHIRGDPTAIEQLQASNVHSFQRPDADHLSFDPSHTTLSGQAGQVSLNKIAGERVRFSSVFGFKSPGFEINDLGFLPRADEIFFSNWIQLRRDRPSRHLRSFRINFNQWSGANFGGDRLFQGGNINAHCVFTNNWRTGAGFTANQNRFDDRGTRGGPLLRLNGNLNFWNYLESDIRKPVHFGWFAIYGGDGQGSHWFEFNPSIAFRPTPALFISAGVAYRDNRNDAQWIENLIDLRDHYVFGHLDQRTLALRTRVNYTITPALSVQVYAEPFVSAGDFSEFKELADGRAETYRQRFAPFLYPGNPDFHYRSFRMTNVLRWEYKPGSTLFLVWQQGREEEIDSSSLGLGQGLTEIFGLPARNVFLVKLAHWFNF